MYFDILFHIENNKYKAKNKNYQQNIIYAFKIFTSCDD